jgi:hypothetical protein
MIDTTGRKRENLRRWLVIVLIAIAAHIVLLFGVKPAYLDVFRKSLDDNVASASRPASMPDAIVAVTIRVEGEEPRPVEIVPVPEPPRESETQPDHTPSENPSETPDITEILGESQNPMPSPATTRRTLIPPRPVEITWPETRDLNHCLGMHVDVRIQVDETGKIRVVEPLNPGLPEDCVNAAVRAARRIVFLPGRADGKPQTMWTEIRIDFRRQSR